MEQDTVEFPRPGRRSRRWRRVAAVALVVVLGIGIAWIGLGSQSSSPDQVLRMDEGSLRYTYHLVSGTEALFDIERDPRCLVNLARERPEEVRRLSRALADQLEVGSLEELRDLHQETIDRLRALGYL